MFSFMIRRLGHGVVLILIVTAITFFLTYGAGIPVATNILGKNATPEAIAKLEAQLGLDLPMGQQYLNWLINAVQGDLGRSYFSNEPVVDAMATRLPVTLSIVFVAAALMLILSTILGVASAARPGILDSILQFISIITFIFPTLILGLGMVFLFAVSLKWVPAVGYTDLSDSPTRWFAGVILPAIVLAIGGIAALAAQIRGSMIDELEKDYIRTLRSRGVPERSLLLKHALRNAASPAFTTFSLQFIGMFGAALFAEKIFALPGYGTYGYQATVTGDLPALLGASLFGILIVVVVNLLVDLANGWLNPKARLT